MDIFINTATLISKYIDKFFMEVDTLSKSQHKWLFFKHDYYVEKQHFVVLINIYLAIK